MTRLESSPAIAQSFARSQMGGTKLTHVPCKGGSQAVMGMVGG